MDLKQTINLPRTSFLHEGQPAPGRAQNARALGEEDLYEQIRKSRAGKPFYILHDGPPYANGRIHLGTAFNKIIKDFIVKSKTMAGYDCALRPRLGLPRPADRAQSRSGARRAKRPQMSAAQIRRACRKYAEKWVNLQREDFKRLGVLGQLGSTLISR